MSIQEETEKKFMKIWKNVAPARTKLSYVKNMRGIKKVCKICHEYKRILCLNKCATCYYKEYYNKIDIGKGGIGSFIKKKASTTGWGLYDKPHFAISKATLEALQ